MPSATASSCAVASGRMSAELNANLTGSASDPAESDAASFALTAAGSAGFSVERLKPRVRGFAGVPWRDRIDATSRGLGISPALYITTSAAKAGVNRPVSKMTSGTIRPVFISLLLKKRYLNSALSRRKGEIGSRNFAGSVPGRRQLVFPQQQIGIELCATVGDIQLTGQEIIQAIVRVQRGRIDVVAFGQIQAFHGATPHESVGIRT